MTFFVYTVIFLSSKFTFFDKVFSWKFYLNVSGLVKCDPMRASSYLSLQGFLNIQNNDEKCFLCSILASLRLVQCRNHDDDDDDELFLRNGWPTKGVYALFPPGTIVWDSHHHKFPTRREQDLNLRRIRVQT